MATNYRYPRMNNKQIQEHVSKKAVAAIARTSLSNENANAVNAVRAVFTANQLRNAFKKLLTKKGFKKHFDPKG